MIRVSIQSAARRWLGFTLVELLIVIGIIALLISTLLVVVKGVVGNARIAATKATIRKVDALLSKRLAAFERYVAGQDRLAGTTGTPSYVTKYLGSGAGVNTASNRILAKKFLFRDSFPQTFAEFTSGSLPNFNSSNHKSETENSEMLYYMLTAMDSFGTESPNADEFKSGEVADTDGDGLMEFIDGWGNPLRFYRWPTRLVRPVLSAGNYSEAQSVTIDDVTNDPPSKWKYFHSIRTDLAYDAAGTNLGILIRIFPRTSTGSYTRDSVAASSPNTTIKFSDEQFDPMARDPQDPLDLLRPGDSKSAPTFAQWMENNLHTGNCYSMPMIISAGPDRILGLLEPTDKSNFGNLAQPDVQQLPALLDDITNLNIQVGGN